MPLELFEDAPGDPRNAAAFALVSDIAYYPESEAAAQFRDQFGLEAKLYSVGNTQAYLAVNDGHIVVAFRGTEAPTSIEGLKDWLLTDAANLLIVPEGRLGTDLAAAGVGARFHQGFVNAIGDIWEPLADATSAEMKKSERPLWLTGHSLGGALALLAAWLFKRRFLRVHQVYTFGGPMIGNKEAMAAIDREFPGKIFRYVHAPDPVPMLPTLSLIANHYEHCQKDSILGEAEAASFLGALSAKAVDGILNATLMDEVWQAVQARVEAHSMVKYLDLIKALGGKS